MSYQTTIADIVTGSQKDFNLQTKNLLKDSNTKQTSFDDLVSFYKQESKIEDKKVSQEKLNNTEKTDTENKEVKESKKTPEDETSEKVKNEEKTETTEKSEKENIQEEKVSAEEKTATEETDKKDLKIKNISVKDVSADDDKELSNKIDNDKKNIKNQKSDKNKKLSSKDFSRIEEFAEKNPQISENIQQPDVDNKKTSKNTKDNDEELEISENEENVSNELNNIQNITTSNQGETENNKDLSSDKKSDDLMLKEKSSGKEKVFLDKDKKIEVQDFRSEAGKVADAVAENKPKMKVSEPKLVNENTAQITMELNQNASANANVLSTNNQTAAANGSNFQAMLNNQIQQSAPEFVKAGNLILKDNNQGTINLVLRPDDLGNVKLHLSLDGKNISGHITVATKEALEVFKDNAETLREAFIKNGFENASFEVSYGNSGSFNQQMGFEQQQDGSEIVAKRVYNNGNNAGENDVESDFDKNSINHDYSINIVA